MTLQININWPDRLSQRLQQAKNFVSESVNSLTNSTQQVRESWTQSAEQIQNTTSTAIQTAINSSVSAWLEQHPNIFRLLQIFGWAVNHPIVSCIILLFVLAILGSIIKAIVRLIETASWSILQIPFKLLFAIINVSFQSFIKIGSLALKQLVGSKQTANLTVLQLADAQLFDKDKQQRLAVISNRLSEIQKEQHELLKEATELLASDTSDIKIEG
ncbi:MAG: hypothetical protein HXY43_20960 [Fischerella sp.]|jgi:hypothetical protein|uniref:hypothetical protein n=1 Tax=Fischerella sp. TaxID=1191 RepID=UPI0017F0A218|nr:hypothetical protein [Fischerella sp.]NWF61651.1 hypothetical protein [Fischerella sp.]